jgi:hypothetical protein
MTFTPERKKISGLTFTTWQKSIMRWCAVKEFVITQTKLDHFEIEYVSEDWIKRNPNSKVEVL